MLFGNKQVFFSYRSRLCVPIYWAKLKLNEFIKRRLFGGGAENCRRDIGCQSVTAVGNGNVVRQELVFQSALVLSLQIEVFLQLIKCLRSPSGRIFLKLPKCKMLSAVFMSICLSAQLITEILHKNLNLNVALILNFV